MSCILELLIFYTHNFLLETHCQAIIWKTEFEDIPLPTSLVGSNVDVNQTCPLYTTAGNV